MNNNSEQITNYLQHKMSANEKAAFEDQLAADTSLQEELQIQRKIIAAAESAGLKIEFAKAIRHRIFMKRLIITGTVIIVSLITVLIINSRDKELNSKNVNATITDSIRPFINPPMPAINVPLSQYSFKAEDGDTIFHATGSVICFPPNAFVDEMGNIIKGTVMVTYREFADPIDFFVSGIPMQYDSAGRKYNFESSGMCEINAYKDNKAVFVNQNARPQLNLSGSNKSPLHNVYFLDTVSRSWKYTGKDIITALRRGGNTKEKDIVADFSFSERIDNLPARPLKPVLASDDHQKFSVKIEPGSFEELFAYDKLRFEVLDESTYKRSDAEEHWDNVKLEHSDTEGIYNIIFTNAVRKVSYKVRPVLNGEDYAAALKVFNEKNKQYEAMLKNRLLQEQKTTDSINLVNKQRIDKMNADKAINDKMNALIAERNEKLKQQRIAIEQQMKADSIMIANQLQIINRNREKYLADMQLSTEVIRTFQINKFGIWNCDHPQYPFDEVPIVANYTDSGNTKIDLLSVAVVYKGFNGITQFPVAGQIRVIPGSENMVWSINGDFFYFFTYMDFAKAGITKNSGTFTFRMRKSIKKISSYSEIRELLEKL
jgi:hypothetical protein